MDTKNLIAFTLEMIGVRNLELLLYLGLVLVKLPILCKMQVQVDGTFFLRERWVPKDPGNLDLCSRIL